MKKTDRKRTASRETEQRQMADLLVCFFLFGHGFGPGLLGLKKLFILFFLLEISETPSSCYGFCSCVDSDKTLRFLDFRLSHVLLTPKLYVCGYDFE